MSTNRSGEAGLTLIEVTIAITLVAVLSVGMMLALRIGLNAMDKANVRLMQNRRVAGTQRIIEQQLAGLVPVTALYRPEGNGGAQPILFFEGEPQVMRFVSTYSLAEASRGAPRILELFVIPGEKEGVRLVVNELLYTGPLSAGALSLGLIPDATVGAAVPQFVPVQARPDSFVLADRLSYCRFFYQEKAPPPDLAVWRQQWIHPTWPTAVRIEMASLDGTPRQLHMMTITAPIHVVREQNRIYLDD